MVPVVLLVTRGWSQPGFAIGMAVNTWYTPNGTAVGLDYAAAALAGFTVVLNGEFSCDPIEEF